MSNYIQDLGVEQDLDGWTDTLKDFGKTALSTIQAHGEAKGSAAAYKAQAEALAAQRAAAAAPSGGMPKWLLPVGIGAGALVLILILKKR